MPRDEYGRSPPQRSSERNKEAVWKLQPGAKVAILPRSCRTAAGKPRGEEKSAPFLSPCLRPPGLPCGGGGEKGAQITEELPQLQSPLFKFIYSTTGDIMIAGV